MKVSIHILAPFFQRSVLPYQDSSQQCPGRVAGFKVCLHFTAFSGNQQGGCVAWDKRFSRRMIPPRTRRGDFFFICFSPCSERSSYWSEREARQAFDVAGAIK